MENPFVLIAVGIWLVAFIGILLEWADKGIIALLGGLLMIAIGILTPTEAIASIGFPTLFLLLAMMILVDIMRRSGIFSWINVTIAEKTHGEPWLVYSLFLIITAVSSAFLNSVSTVLLMIPITIALAKGMGFNARYFVISVILFANIGGSLTLIGDPANVLIGTSLELSFNDFIINLYRPVGLVLLFAFVALSLPHLKDLKPISTNLRMLYLSHLMIHKIRLDFLKAQLKRPFIVKCLLVFVLTLLSFIFQQQIGFPVFILALLGAVLLALLCRHEVEFHEVFREVEWTTLAFFSGLFVMVGGLEQVHVLDSLAHWISGLTQNLTLLLIVVLWGSAFVSAILDNVAFAAIMIPVLQQLQHSFSGTQDPRLLFWALSLGAILGGSGTPIGSSANLVSIGIAGKYGIHISFLNYLKTSAPILVGMLFICSFYFWAITT